MEFVLKDISLPAVVRLPEPVNDQKLLRFCALNGELRIERESSGELFLMFAVGGRGEAIQQTVGLQLSRWANVDGRGVPFDSSTRFRLPNGSVRMPDASWLSRERLSALASDQHRSCASLCPEFVIEILSESDSLERLSAKMEMWIANGADLAWLIEPELARVTVFRAGQYPEVHDEPTSVEGTGPVAGFVLKLDPSELGQHKASSDILVGVSAGRAERSAGNIQRRIEMKPGLTVPQSELPLRFRPVRPMNEQEFLRFCAVIDFARVEREPNGEILVMSPANSKTSNINSRICRLLDEWAEEDGRGVAFDSSGGFTLLDGSMRSPDAAWVLRRRWDALTEAQQSSFAPLCPDFVIELRSPSDKLAEVQAKMVMWIANGAEVAWLIDPESRMIEIYRPGDSVEQFHEPSSVQGTGPVAGFELVMARVWQ